jgi:diacylglycerol kinase
MTMQFDPVKLFNSFRFAFNGLSLVIREQQNFRIHLLAACIVVVAGIFTGLSGTEWCIVVILIFLVLAMEALNSAIEKLVDFVSPEYHKQAGAVKDISAAAVLLTAISAVVAGLIIFLPRLISFKLNQ